MVVPSAKLTGLAVIVFVLAFLVEWVTGSPLSRGAFREGMGIAYVCALVCSTAFTLMADSLIEDAVKAALLCACASVLWAISTFDGYGFALLCLMNGVWYGTLLRRI
ncbi:MAG: hypothetical protein GKR94_11685 [Gammaproteobacteria bacterium]|nr:hypothetical protein [Gammaproteobacteria bacterium]